MNNLRIPYFIFIINFIFKIKKKSFEFKIKFIPIQKQHVINNGNIIIIKTFFLVFI